MPQLAEFLRSNRESIMVDWEAFARTCGPASGTMNVVDLRDHASEMLTVIADDLDTPQSQSEQVEKSKGDAPAETTQTAAAKHGAGRADSGFSIEQMVSEYRALRASVIRLWTKDKGKLGEQDIEELTRFNEAIDQSLAESIWQYTQDLEHSKEMFLAILGHDLRSPLGAVMMSSQFMLDRNDLKEPNLTLTTQISKSAVRMNQMIGDLLDFTRTRLGDGIPVALETTDMQDIVKEVVAEIAAAHPARTITVDSPSPQNGKWDRARIAQVLTNLINNAIEHGSDQSRITITICGAEHEVVVDVHNLGEPIPAATLNGIFNPMKRKASMTGPSSPTANLGLGLYIADRIVHSHRGRITVQSRADGTTFSIHLPRSVSVAPVAT